MKNKTAYLWGVLGKLGPQLIALGSALVLVRFVSPSEFGQIAILTIFTTVSQTLLEAGLGGSLIKEEKVSAIDYSTMFVFNIAVSFLLYAAIFIASPWIEAFYKIAGLSTVCRLLCLVFVINSWGQIAQTVLFRELQFKTLMTSSILSGLAGATVAIVTAVWLRWGVYSLVAQQLTQSATYVLLNWARCSIQPSFHFSKTSFRKLFSFGFFTTIIGIIESVYENLITSLFGKYLGINQAGYLSQAKRIEVAAVSSLSSTINSVAFPILTRLKNDRREFDTEASNLLKNLSLLVLPALLCVALLADPIVLLLFGKKWIAAAPYLRVLMWIGCFVVLEAANRNFIKSLGDVRELLKYTVVKRTVGILLMGVSILVNTDWLIYAYLGGSIVGYFANAHCYSGLMGKDRLRYSVTALRYFLLPVLCYLVGMLPRLWLEADSLWYVAVTLLLYAAYYLLVLPRLGIHLLHLFSKRR